MGGSSALVDPVTDNPPNSEPLDQGPALGEIRPGP
jgi:hypothetical protein